MHLKEYIADAKRLISEVTLEKDSSIHEKNGISNILYKHCLEVLANNLEINKFGSLPHIYTHMHKCIIQRTF